MKKQLFCAVCMMLLSCSKRLEVSLVEDFKLPKSSILGFSKKVGIVVKDYALLTSEIKKSSTDYDYLTIIKKDETVRIEKIMHSTEKYGLKGNWILVSYKGKTGYIFSGDINIIDNIIID
ncbi:hypothetical protein LKV13_04215 [Borrelia sp. BU AG58]|uniref:hypothetical protein n=1 Tax=Borrelia sp. BU AG58 TaxID=2887345 RepID=UPI001E294D9F|nr:hypothetical protein [Borrelia sp. BU AG58]UER67963.1 hypothetical protein LKV13_04215 [Borrelia sp. BU AG58]